jgi:hypothetical protein
MRIRFNGTGSLPYVTTGFGISRAGLSGSCMASQRWVSHFMKLSSVCEICSFLETTS